VASRGSRLMLLRSGSKWIVAARSRPAPAVKDLRCAPATSWRPSGVLDRGSLTVGSTARLSARAPPAPPPCGHTPGGKRWGSGPGCHWWCCFPKVSASSDASHDVYVAVGAGPPTHLDEAATTVSPVTTKARACSFGTSGMPFRNKRWSRTHGAHRLGANCKDPSGFRAVSEQSTAPEPGMGRDSAVWPETALPMGPKRHHHHPRGRRNAVSAQSTTQQAPTETVSRGAAGRRGPRLPVAAHRQ